MSRKGPSDPPIFTSQFSPRAIMGWNPSSNERFIYFLYASLSPASPDFSSFPSQTNPLRTCGCNSRSVVGFHNSVCYFSSLAYFFLSFLLLLFFSFLCFSFFFSSVASSWPIFFYPLCFLFFCEGVGDPNATKHRYLGKMLLQTTTTIPPLPITTTTGQPLPRPPKPQHRRQQLQAGEEAHEEAGEAEQEDAQGDEDNEGTWHPRHPLIV